MQWVQQALRGYKFRDLRAEAGCTALGLCIEVEPDVQVHYTEVGPPAAAQAELKGGPEDLAESWPLPSDETRPWWSEPGFRAKDRKR